MPSRTPTNTKQSKKAGSAAKQSTEAIRSAVEKMSNGHADAGEFYSVQKVLGNGSFLIRNAAGLEVRGAGGHGGGRVRMHVGHIVLAVGDPKQGLEIIGVIEDRNQANALVKAGFMKQAVITAALSAGAVSSAGAAVEEDGYVFAEPEGGEGEGDVDVDAL
jgi:hypothetical protein